MSNKQDLPISSSTNSNYTSESNYMKTLIDTKPRSSLGDVSFTSTTSSIVYNTATYKSGIYANQGQEGLLLVLQDALNLYLISSADFNNKVDNNYSITSHVGNAYSVTVPNLTSLSDGTPLCVKFDATSTGAITINPNSIGAKSVVDYFGNAVTNVRANLIANLRYDSISQNFILLGKGGGGNATASQLLSGATATVDAGPITGAMINNGVVTITPSTVNQALLGYYASTSKVNGDANLIAANILKGKSIFGIAGAVGRRATGSIVASHLTGSTIYTNFNTDSIWSSTTAYPVLTVTGLSFLPSIIIATFTNGTLHSFSIYSANPIFSTKVSPSATVVWGNVGGAVGFSYLAGNVYVSSSGFQLPWNDGNGTTDRTFNWLAIE